MGEATILQQAELDARRQALKARVLRFRTQVSEDRDALLDESRQLAGRESEMAEHTGTIMAASAAVGFVAGLAPKPGVPRPHVSGPVKKVAGKGASVGGGVLAAELTTVAKDFFDGLFDRQTGERRPDEERAVRDALAAG